MNHSKAALLEALNTLIIDPDAKHLFASLMAVAQLKSVHPVYLAGEAAVLNPLVDAYRESPEWFDRQIAKVDDRRRALLKAPLVPPPDDGFDKSAYMREFMQTKRTRMRRAADIENMLRPARDRLVGRARLDFMDAAAAKWKAEMDRRVEAARQVADGGRLPKETLDTVRKQFWEYVDQQLDEAEQRALKQIRG